MEHKTKDMIFKQPKIETNSLRHQRITDNKEVDMVIIFPKPIEPIPMKWDGVETIGTFRRFTKIYPDGKSTE